MATIVLRDFPAGLRERLEERARLHGRSLDGEVIACLEATLGQVRIDVEEELARIRRHREQIAATTNARITNAEIDRAKRKGRP